jgi:hypothetical protein
MYKKKKKKLPLALEEPGVNPVLIDPTPKFLGAGLNRFYSRLKTSSLITIWNETLST